MSAKPYLSALIPVYNEEENLPALGEEVSSALNALGKPYEVILVDDGSTDQTVKRVEEIKSSNIKLIKHGTNKGLSEAIKTGLLEALSTSSDNDVIVTMDADNTHCPGLVFRMASLIDEGNDVIIASRYVSGARVLGLSAGRRLLSLCASIFLRCLFSTQGVKDYTSGYRAYRAGILKKAFEKWGDGFISESGFSCIVDILLKLRNMNVVINEVPLILHYDYKFGPSKINIWKTIKQVLRLSLVRLLK